MIEKLAPYARYVSSGSPFLGAVPSGWERGRLRALLTARSDRGRPDLPLLSVARERGVFVRSLSDDDENHNAIPEDLTNYKVARAGNLVINKMKAWQGSMGIAPVDGIVSPAYFVFDLRMAEPRFAEYLLRSKLYVALFGQASDGVRVGQWDLSVRGLREIPVAVPSAVEQRAIVRFLDYADRRIRKYIAAKRKLIALLEEQKRAIIDRAVTRGLDPNVRLKDSGVPWIGMVPEHWSRTKLRRVCRSIRDGSHNPPPPVNSPYRILSARNIVDGELVLRPDDRRLSESAFHELERSFTIRNGDVVVASVGATTGKCAVVQLSELVTAQRSLAILRPNSSLIRAGFLELAIQSSAVQDQIKERMTKYAAQPGIYLDELGGLLIPLPSLCEQDAIVASVRERISSLALLRHSAIQELGSLDQLRTRLTSDVVTGKLDVRDAAANLPDEPSDVPDDTALLDDDSAEAHEEQEES